MNNKEWYDHCKKNGLCVSCHKPSDTGKRYCSECAEKYRKKNAELRKFYLSKGICPVCRKNTLEDGESTCYECRWKRSEKTRDLSKLYFYNAERRKRFKNERRCITCGKPLPEGDRHSTCESCRKKRREEYGRTKSQDRKLRPLNNLCYICGSDDLVDGKNVCHLCYKRIVKNTKKARNGQGRKK